MYGSEPTTFAIYPQPLIRPEYERLLAGTVRGLSTVTIRRISQCTTTAGTRRAADAGLHVDRAR